MTSGKLQIAKGTPDYVRRAYEAFRVFLAADMPSTDIPPYLRIVTHVQLRQWDKYLDSLEGAVDRLFFTPEERDIAQINIVSSAAIILAWERITGREASARKIFSAPLKEHHLAVPITLGAISTAVGFTFMRSKL